MNGKRSLLWFAQFEARLAWRDLVSMMTAGRKRRARGVAIGFATVAILLHGFALLVLKFAHGGIRTDIPTLIIVTTAIVLSGSAMLAQGLESVTRTFYVRSDLELILTAPVPAGNIFAVRIVAMATAAAFMSVLTVGPFIDVLAWQNGARWLSAYGILASVSLTSTAFALALTILLFKTLGPKLTRLIAQIAAAVIGGTFVIGLQVAAMLSTGTLSRFALLQSPGVMRHAPGLDSIVWLPARAALGDWRALIAVLGASLLLFAATTARFAPRFGDYALAATSMNMDSGREKPRGSIFQVRSISSSLRLKERRLLLRDPWLISQSLMQLLYLLPPALLLWRSLGQGARASLVLVPVLIMTAGQLAGGLAWLAISGEDAPDLVRSAPISPGRLLRAKTEAVMQCVAAVVLPFAALLAWNSPRQAIIVVIVAAAAGASSTAIQLWFRSQSKRNLFRRRHTSSRIATLSEALVSITWAGTGAVAAVATGLGAVVALIPLLLLLGVRALSPARSQLA